MNALLQALMLRLSSGGRRLGALLFDVDGTLADTEEAHRQTFNQAFSLLGLPWHWSVAEYTELLAVSGGRERIVHYLNTLVLHAGERERLQLAVDTIHAKKNELYTQRVARGEVPLRPGVRELLVEARSRGLPLAIATTTSPANVTALLQATLGPDGPAWFAVIAAGDCVARKKPAPDVYQHALAALGESPAHCVAFEDSDSGLRAAAAAGLYTVVTPTGWTAHHDLSQADLLLCDLAEKEGTHAT